MVIVQYYFSSLLNMAIEIVSFPNHHGDLNHTYVELAEGIFLRGYHPGQSSQQFIAGIPLDVPSPMWIHMA